jgi:hypothetical protein
VSHEHDEFFDRLLRTRHIADTGIPSYDAMIERTNDEIDNLIRSARERASRGQQVSRRRGSPLRYRTFCIWKDLWVVQQIVSNRPLFLREVGRVQGRYPASNNDLYGVVTGFVKAGVLERAGGARYWVCSVDVDRRVEPVSRIPVDVLAIVPLTIETATELLDQP